MQNYVKNKQTDLSTLAEELVELLLCRVEAHVAHV